MTTPVLRDRLAALVAPRYILDRELASGGMGLVFLGHDPVLGRDVAIKLLPPEQATAVARERFLREARAMAQLAHPHVVPILEVQEQGGLLWFVMPHLDGDTLAHRIGEGALPSAVVKQLGCELLDALAFAHSHGIVHRDVKPGNIFLQGDHALLADFGVALLHDPDADTLTEAGRLIGTLRYMTPEQLTGTEATSRSDLYSLAATLYEAVTGRQWSPALHAVAGTWEGIDPRLAAVLRRALEPLPDRRWPDAASFRTALDRTGARRWTGLVIGTAIVAVGAAVAMTWGARPTTVPLRRFDLAVLRFEGIDTGAANSLARHTTNLLEGFPRLRVMPWSRLIGPTADPDVPPAALVVRGAFDTGRAGATLSIAVRDIHDSLVRRFVVRGAIADPKLLGEAIADSLIRRLYPEWLTEFRQFSLCESGQGSPEVWQPYWAGEVAFQQSRWEDAEREFRKAWRLDTTFASALWYDNLSQQFRRVASNSALQELARHNANLCAPLGELVRFQLEPDLGVRLAGYESLARRYPEYPPVRLMLANELFHRGPLIGRSLQEAVDTFHNSAVQLADLDQATTYMHIIWGALRIGNESMARLALSQRGAVTNDAYTPFLRLATEARFRPWLARPLRTLAFWLADSAFVADAGELARIGLEMDIPDAQLAFGRLLAGPTHGATERRRASGHAAEATALLLLGRPMEALRQLDFGAAFTGPGSGFRLQSWEWRVLLPVAGMPGIPPSEVELGRRRLAAIPSTDPRWPRAAWALFLDANARRDAPTRDRWRAALHLRAPADSVAQHLALLADAIALGTDGEIDSALTLSRAIHRHPSDSMAAWRGPFTRAMIHLARAEWQLARDDSAADREWRWHENNDFRGWPAGEPQEGEIDAALSALVRLRRAERLLAQGERSPACALDSRVAELWHRAEPSFDSLRRAVQQLSDRCRD